MTDNSDIQSYSVAEQIRKTMNLVEDADTKSLMEYRDSVTQEEFDEFIKFVQQAMRDDEAGVNFIDVTNMSDEELDKYI